MNRKGSRDVEEENRNELSNGINTIDRCTGIQVNYTDRKKRSLCHINVAREILCIVISCTLVSQIYLISTLFIVNQHSFRFTIQGNL